MYFLDYVLCGQFLILQTSCVAIFAQVCTCMCGVQKIIVFEENENLTSRSIPEIHSTSHILVVSSGYVQKKYKIGHKHTFLEKSQSLT